MSDAISDTTTGPANEPWLLRAAELKQWVYCPRVVYYAYFMPSIRPETALMEEGRLSHEEEAVREVRRSLKRYGLDEAQRHQNVMLTDPALGLSGRVDLVLQRDDETIPVEYKLYTNRFQRHHRIQLTVYALLLEANGWGDSTGRPVRRGFLYAIEYRQAEEVAITPKLRDEARALVRQAQAMIRSERMPEPTDTRARCVSCEFRRFCNDMI